MNKVVYVKLKDEAKPHKCLYNNEDEGSNEFIVNDIKSEYEQGSVQAVFIVEK